MGGIAGARWQDDDQIHLTLRFIGEVDARQGDDIAVALQQVRCDPFTLTLEGSGTFSVKQRVHTLWAGVLRSDALESLRRRVDRAVATIVRAERASAYVPHVTLARFSRSGAPANPLSVPPIPTTTFDVRNFQLLESTLTSDGATYSMIERYTLG
jgi:2'-5' RNA ligase